MGRAWLRALVVLVPTTAWASLSFIGLAKQWPLVGEVWRFSRFAFDELGVSPAMGWACKGALFTALGIAVLRLFIRRPFLLHALRLDPSMWRLLLLALLVALPVQVALGLSPGMQHFYRRFFEVGGAERVLANAITIVAEHLWIEGVVLGLALLPGLVERMRDDERGPRTGRLARFGLGFPAAGPRTVSAWLGVPREAWPAIVAQGALFFLGHFTKDPGEVASSLPGGLAVGWLSLRTRSFVPAMVLHLITGAVVLGTMALARGGG